MSAKSAPLRIHALRKAEVFRRILGQRPRAMSAHFAVHHLVTGKVTSSIIPGEPVVPELSTDSSTMPASFVDDSFGSAARCPYALGLVVPKRHARRAVTRSLIKRELRAAWWERLPSLEPGAWLLRLRSGFDTVQFVSAASAPLRIAVRAEIRQVLDRCITT